jgi:hypothetical protein
VLALALLVPVASVGQHFFGTATPFSTGKSFGGRGYLTEPVEKPSGQVFAEKLRADGVIEEGSRLVAGSGYAIRTLIYAFYMRVQIFGRDQPHDITDPRFQQVLRDNRIDYYFLYEPTEQEPMDVSAWGTVKERYEMPYECGPYVVDGVEKPSSGCRLSIVAVRP